jgi:hypothetical protein
MTGSVGWSQGDWYSDGEDQIHFFPFPKRLVWTSGKKIVAQIEAWGGVRPQRGIRYKTMKPHPTTPGGYVISGWGPYLSHRWPLSRIRWGTPLRLDPSGTHLLYRTDVLGRWRRVDAEIPHITVDDIIESFYSLYGADRKYDRDGDGIPDEWVFNDFGPIAINYFRDPNRNRKLDAGERIMGEMIHTTQENEAQTDRKLPVVMTSSHGCIHLRPADLSRFLRMGAFKVGTLLFVHGPNEVVPEVLER